MPTPQETLAEYNMLRQREAILEAQLAMGAEQGSDDAKARAALEASRSFQLRKDAEATDHHRKQELQGRYDEVFEAHNLATPMPRADELSSQYHRRLLRTICRNILPNIERLT